MKCRDVNKKLLFYLDDELSEREKKTVELHLATCPDCRRELESLAAAQDLLRQGFRTLNTKTVPSWTWIEIERRLAAAGPAKTSHFSGIVSRIRSFVSRQPIWKPVLSSITVITVIALLTLLIPKVSGPSPEVLASEIAKDAPEVRALVGGEPAVQASKVSGTTGYVLNQGITGESNLAYVNLQNSTVVRIYRLTLPSLTEEDRIEVTDIARANPDIQQIMNRGGVIERVYLLSYLLRLELINGEPAVWSEGILAGVTLRETDRRWIARVDTSDEGKVIDITEMSTLPYTTWTTESPMTKYTKEELIDIASSDARVSELLDKGARVTGVATGIRKTADIASVILKLGEETWAVKIDLDTLEVSEVETISAAKYDKLHFFKLEE